MKLLILLFFITINISASEFTKMAETEFKTLISKDITFKMKKYKIPSSVRNEIQKKVKQRFYKKWLYFWKITDKNSKTYYSFVDNVMGKQYPITFMVVFDNKGNIILSKILKYRNLKGRELKKASWLNQFLNMNNKSSFVLDKDIDGISGATISSKALTKGFQKLSILISKIIK